MFISDVFTVSLGIYDHSLTHVESKNYDGGAYPITIAFEKINVKFTDREIIDNNSDIISINNYTEAGVYTSQPFYIFGIGNYSVTVSSSAEPRIIPAKIVFKIK